MNEQVYFLETTWYFPDGDNCYEEIDRQIGPISLFEALEYLRGFLNNHPNAFHEDSDVGIIEVSDDISEHQQKSARIETA